MQPFHVVAVLHEVVGQVVQQRRVGGRVGQVHVVHRFHDASAEIVVPNTVHERPGKVRVFAGAQPLHQRLSWVGIIGQVHLLAAEHAGGDDPAAVPLFLVLRFIPGRFAFWVGDVQLLPRNRLAGLGAALDLRAQLLAVGFLLLVVSDRLLDLLHERLIIFASAELVAFRCVCLELNRLKEGLEFLEVLLRPLVEWMLVALGALDAHPEEGVREAQRLFLRLADISPCPVVRHAFARVKRNRPVGLVMLAHALGELHE